MNWRGFQSKFTSKINNFDHVSNTCFLEYCFHAIQYCWLFLSNNNGSLTTSSLTSPLSTDLLTKNLMVSNMTDHKV